MSPDVDHCKKYETAGPHLATLLGVYSALPLCFGHIVNFAPAIVLLNQSYDLLIETAFIKQFLVKTCHKEDELTILNYTLPIYYKIKSEGSSDSLNLVYQDCIIQLNVQLIVIITDLLLSKFINIMGSQLRIPDNFFGEVVASYNYSQVKPSVAPELAKIIEFGNFDDIRLPSKYFLNRLFSRENVIKLPESQQKTAVEVLNRFEHVFAKDKKNVMLAKNFQHYINTSGTSPIRLRPIQKSLADKFIIDEEINTLVKRGIIVSSKSF